MKRVRVALTVGQFNRGPDADAELISKYMQLHGRTDDAGFGGGRAAAGDDLNVTAPRFRFRVKRPRLI